MSGFDFASTWGVVNIDTGSGTTVSYPYLTANQQDPEPGRETVTKPLYAGGDGTASNPYQIENWNHLDNVRDNLDANFTLVSDIDQNTAGYADVASGSANGGKGFDPVGNSPDAFTGTFDGNDHVIEDLFIDRTGANYVGLFGVNEGTIKNIGLKNVDVSGASLVGGLVGRSFFGDVSNASVTGSVSGTNNVGGLVGQGPASDSYATATVSGDVAVGGLVGTVRTGGSQGVSDSYATGDVSGNQWVGGLAGVSKRDVSNSYATGDVSAPGGSSVGGLIGRLDGAGDVSTSYAVGAVTGDIGVGGLVGSGFAGATTNSYWDEDTTGQSSSAGGTGLTTSEMQGSSATSKMSGFDFANTWTTVTSPDDYPELQAVG
jgi:hypothetical protein